MPDNIAYLEGGPCHGKTRKITGSVQAHAQIVCGGEPYVASYPLRHHEGDQVWQYAGKTTQPGGKPPTQPEGAHLHKGYADLQRSVNRHMPAALASAHHNLAAGLRSVHRARKVRI